MSNTKRRYNTLVSQAKMNVVGFAAGVLVKKSETTKTQRKFNK